jgi:DNA-binding response OmpR family regulator
MTAKLRLVLVEDNPIDGELIARHLAHAGLDCLIHRVQTEAGLLSALSAVQPHLIISDFTLPSFNGLRALEIANTHAPETPFIFVSGTLGEERAIEAMREGATDYVLKGNLVRLSASVQRALREASVKSKQREAERQAREQAVRLERLSRSYRMLSHTSSAMLRLRNRAELLDNVCRIVLKQGGYDRVVVSLVDANAKSLKPCACAGVDHEPLRAIDSASLDAHANSMSLVQQAFHGREPRILNDLATESEPTAHQQVWLAHGWTAVAALPLIIDGKAEGAMTLFSAQPRVFDEAEVSILLELTANLCFALQCAP